MLFSRNVLQRILGALWLIDGILQVQPRMFTGDMINGVMRPMLQGQPGLIEPSLQYIVAQTTAHLTAINWLIAVVQVLLGLAFLTLPGRVIKPVVLLSIVWSLIVWYGGEGMSMLLTGTASILTGAPGAVLLYPLLGLVIWPRQKPSEESKKIGNAGDEEVSRKTGDDGLISRRVLRWVLAAFWIFAGLLQLQPNWWQPGQISQAIGAMVGQGGLNNFVIDPILQRLSDTTANSEVALNIALIVVFLGLGIALFLVKEEKIRPLLIVSIVLSLLVWYITQGFGMVLTGMATDFNSGLLIIVMALACWPRSAAFDAARTRARTRFMHEMRQAQRSDAAQTV